MIYNTVALPIAAFFGTPFGETKGATFLQWHYAINKKSVFSKRSGNSAFLHGRCTDSEYDKRGKHR
jgi:hypothetical protein